jgi:hypothetical protein
VAAQLANFQEGLGFMELVRKCMHSDVTSGNPVKFGYFTLLLSVNNTKTLFSPGTSRLMQKQFWT